MNKISLDLPYFQNALLQLHDAPVGPFGMPNVRQLLAVNRMLLPSDENGTLLLIEPTACERLIQAASAIASMQTPHPAVEKFKKIIAVFEQIRGSQFETAPIVESGAWQLAAYFNRLQTSPARSGRMELKEPSSGLFRRTQWEPLSKLFTIVSCADRAKICASGAYKEVHSSLSFHIETAQAVETVFMLTIGSDNIALCTAEMDLYEHIKQAFIKEEDSPVAAPLATSFIYNDAQKISRVTGVFPAYEASCNMVAAHKDAFSMGQKLHIAHDLCKNLLQLHDTLKIIHGDIKPENGLYKLTSADTAIAKWTDLGFAFKDTSAPSFTFKNGTYGTVTQTAPEFFGLENQTLAWKEYVQLETWAFGCTLYSMFIENKLPWQDPIRNYFKMHEACKTADPKWTFDEKMRAPFAERVAQALALFVEEPLEKTDPITEKSQQLQINCVIWKMLRRDPACRNDLKATLSGIQKLIETYDPTKDSHSEEAVKAI